MAKTFKYKTGRIVPKIEAQDLGEELERIREKHGELTAKHVVQESRPKSAPLHEVCDLHIPAKDRAEMWSEHQARRAINVLVAVSEKEGVPDAPAYVNVTVGNVTNPEQRHYEAIENILADPEQRADMVQRALEKLVRVQREFRHLRELANVWSAIDTAIETGVA